MLRTDLVELIRNGENSGVEFKRDDIRPDSLATEIAALLNLEGGYILLGIEDGGAVSGLTRPPHAAEEWVMNVCRNNLQPPIIPYWETINWDGEQLVGVLSLPADSPDKPYKARRGNAWVTYVRVGTTSRESTREEEARLYQASGWTHFDIKPVPGSTFQNLDRRRLVNYFRDVRQQEFPSEEDTESWIRLLLNTDLMVNDRDRAIPTAGAVLLFGLTPNRFLPMAGITATAYLGDEKDYATRESVSLRGPISPLRSQNDEIIETGLIEQTIDFVRRNTIVEAYISPDGRRQDRWRDYPLEAVREAVVNAIAHRDYSIAVTDIELSIYMNRLEIISPGRLTNTVTVEKMRSGYRATRNELIKEILRDYRYIESRGLGVPRKIIQGMKDHNGTEPDLIEEDSRFTVRLWKERQA
jgi:ATP-dependent DNA helicase RecG